MKKIKDIIYLSVLSISIGITLIIWWYLIPSLLEKIRQIDIYSVKIILFGMVSYIFFVGNAAILGYGSAQIINKIENIKLIKKQEERNKKLNLLL